MHKKYPPVARQSPAGGACRPRPASRSAFALCHHIAGWTHACI